MPAVTASAVLSRSPVRAHQVPSSPGVRGRNQVAPTSGKKPMPTSGIAKENRSPATRCEPCTETPTPPPITMPSISATYGLGRSEEHTSELQSRSDLVCRLLLEKKKTTTDVTESDP